MNEILIAVVAFMLGWTSNRWLLRLGMRTLIKRKRLKFTLDGVTRE